MDRFDITILGSGIASTLTLIDVLDQLLNKTPATRPVTIAVIEKNPEFFKGIPYGARSSVNALTITCVHDFLHETERPFFYSWLSATKDTWTAYYRQEGGLTAARWLERNLPLMEREEWETVYIPRFLFGNYLHEKLGRLQKAAGEKNLAEVRLIRGEAIEVKVAAAGGYEIIFEASGVVASAVVASSVASRKVVIATGSAPVRKMCDVPAGHALYINDMYEPSVAANIQALQTALSAAANAEDRNVLIIGSNASSIELLYLLEGMPAVREQINKMVILSGSGLLPYHISTEALDSHPIPHLDKVKAGGGYTIGTLTDAAALDIQLAVRDGANMEYIATIIGQTLQLMEVLGEEAKKAFYAIHAIRLRDMFRRSGPEYKNAAQLLLDLQQVTMLKGRFCGVREAGEGGPGADGDPAKAGVLAAGGDSANAGVLANAGLLAAGGDPANAGVLFEYLDAATGQQQTYPLSVKAVINCSGSDNLDQSSSRLLYNLVANNICQMNLSGKGFEVNDKFEAAPNLYVMGPLLGGNMNKRIHFWQLENASRLTSLAPYLAAELLDI